MKELKTLVYREQQENKPIVLPVYYGIDRKQIDEELQRNKINIKLRSVSSINRGKGNINDGQYLIDKLIPHLFSLDCMKDMKKPSKGQLIRLLNEYLEQPNVNKYSSLIYYLPSTTNSTQIKISSKPKVQTGMTFIFTY